jgi:hypothetical protein
MHKMAPPPKGRHAELVSVPKKKSATDAGQLLHGEEHAAFADAGYQGGHKRAEAVGPTWHVAMRPGLRRKLNSFIEPEFVARTRGEDEGQHPRQGRASVPYAQALATKMRWTGKKHGADRLAVRDIEPADGAMAVDGNPRMSAPAARQTRARRDQIASRVEPRSSKQRVGRRALASRSINGK